jgi:hypothetical protein
LQSNGNIRALPIKNANNWDSLGNQEGQGFRRAEMIALLENTSDLPVIRSLADAPREICYKFYWVNYLRFLQNSVSQQIVS